MNTAQEFPMGQSKKGYSHNMSMNPIKHHLVFDEKTITCDNVEFFIGHDIDNTLPDNNGLPHYIARDHGICFCRNPGNRRVQVIHNESWTLITSFETGLTVEKLFAPMAKLARDFVWTKSYAEIKTLEKQDFEKYFFGVLSQLRKDCGAWKDIY